MELTSYLVAAQQSAKPAAKVDVELV
jgi:hypothetical protein